VPKIHNELRCCELSQRSTAIKGESRFRVNGDSTRGLGRHLVGTSKIILNRLCEPQPHTGEPEELNAPLRTMFAPRKDVMGTPDSGRGKAV